MRMEKKYVRRRRTAFLLMLLLLVSLVVLAVNKIRSIPPKPTPEEILKGIFSADQFSWDATQTGVRVSSASLRFCTFMRGEEKIIVVSCSEDTGEGNTAGYTFDGKTLTRVFVSEEGIELTGASEEGYLTGRSEEDGVLTERYYMITENGLKLIGEHILREYDVLEEGDEEPRHIKEESFSWNGKDVMESSFKTKAKQVEDTVKAFVWNENDEAGRELLTR